MKNSTLYILTFLLTPWAIAQNAPKEKKGAEEAVTEIPPPIIKIADEAPQETTVEESEEEREISHLEGAINLLSLKKNRLAAEYELAEEELRKKRVALLRESEAEAFNMSLELAKTKREIERLNTETELIEKKLSFDAAQHKSKIAKELSALRYKEEKLKAENDLYVAEQLKRSNEIKYSDAELKSQKLKREYELAAVEVQIKEHSKRDQLEGLAERSRISYLKNPMEKDTLVISDRRIALNDAITYTTADHVTERINFYNNKSQEHPIFIIIDYSPGGSVMSGYRILKAMEGSQAPVYVVVKSFAASMAAAITTLADKSYAYPNALILHHQMSYGVRGNLTQQKEMLEESEEWWTRLAGPIAKKMGLTLDEFIKRMYDNDSGGDWVEFADEARNLKWVDHIVNEIRETSLLENPDKKPKPMPTLIPLRGEAQGEVYGEQINQHGERFHLLPRLVPYDFYYLYNPDNFYRM